MKRLLKEPLFHFLLLGAGLFIAYDLISKPGSSAAPGKIVVTVGHVEHLAAGFAKTWRRPPTDAEIKGLVDDWVRERGNRDARSHRDGIGQRRHRHPPFAAKTGARDR